LASIFFIGNTAVDSRPEVEVRMDMLMYGSKIRMIVVLPAAFLAGSACATVQSRGTLILPYLCYGFYIVFKGTAL